MSWPKYARSPPPPSGTSARYGDRRNGQSALVSGRCGANRRVRARGGEPGSGIGQRSGPLGNDERDGERGRHDRSEWRQASRAGLGSALACRYGARTVGWRADHGERQSVRRWSARRLGQRAVRRSRGRPGRPACGGAAETSTYRLQTFRSPDFGALGHVDGDGVQVLRATRRRHAPDTEFTQTLPAVLPRVDIVLSYAGVDGVMVEAARNAGARGIVSAGLAPGIATPAERTVLEAAVAAGSWWFSAAARAAAGLAGGATCGKPG